MLSMKNVSKWFVAAAVPAALVVYYTFALPGASQADSNSSDAITQQQRADAPLVTGLPDFTLLVERYGPSVVNVSVTGST